MPRQPSRLPAVVSSTHVAQVRAADEAFKGLDARYGGGLGFSGSVLWELGMHSQHITETRHRLTTSVAACPEGRGRADAQIHHARLVMATGDPREATALGTQGLDWAGPLRSGRITHYLRTLYRAADPHVGIPLMREAIAGHLEVMREHGDPIPAPSAINAFTVAS